MTDSPSRREELIAGALAGDLDAAERGEFTRASAADPTMLEDLHEMQETAGLLARAGIGWQESDPPPDLGRRILASTSGSASDPGPPAAAPDRGPREDRPRRRRPARAALLSLAAAGFLAMGALGGVLVDQRLQAAPSGPPGTLGAVEDVEVADLPRGTSIEVALVAHTWGTETVLEVDGLGVGDSYEVVLVREDGREMPSGTFLGSEVRITCHLNAAVLREDVAEVRIRDATGEVVLASQVPRV